ncbi:hypothetical protein F4678DRAFT_460803 [Xylaria arbuscula]|nr:hypothetical protein F4678DRAFT_460803 [Xylaria arbuscula]
MVTFQHPLIRRNLDGAADDEHTLAVIQPAIPKYDVTEDSDVVPEYTREYLQNLSTAVATRLKYNDDEISYYAEALARTQKIHKYLMAILMLIGALWFLTSIMVAVIVVMRRAAKQQQG